ncbi:MAG TPA: FAD-dependent oxidoreductase [Solirubrobacterales bacterium]|jgi:monoamine oxidase|nr:FAD-dependent oxidoreductase [Solirubrobacterales bacterium]
MPESPTSAQLDIAIVGGGVSGLYTAWRLLLDAKENGMAPPRVIVFESSDRVGGRLLTWLPAGPAAGLRAELGGMRFFQQQEMVWNLLIKLGFKEDIVDFYVGGNNLRLLLRGVSGPLETTEPAKRYMIDESLRKLSSAAILKSVIEAVLKANQAVIDKYLGGKPPTTREQWDMIKPYLSWRERPLWDVGFWNLLSELYNPETYAFIADAFGYYSIAANWNAAEAMQSTSLDFTENPEYKTLSQGYSALPDALAAQVEALGGQIALQTRLVSFQGAGSGAVNATFASGSNSFQVKAGSLVLGLPRRSLDLLAPSPDFDPQGDPALKSLLESVTSTPAFKLFLFFEKRWWQSMGIDRGRSICDLPLRQTYYMAPDAYYEGKPAPEFGVLMASYDDQRAVEFWQGLIPPEDEWEEGREQLRGALADLVANDPIATDPDAVTEPPPNLHLATEEMVDHALEQLELLQEVPPGSIERPKVGAFADWSFDPFGGGWNFWEPQIDVKQAMTDIKQPFGDLRAYVVGEAYSGVQGWVEGALTSAELVLEEHFGLKRPAWLPADYYLGW